MANLELIDYTDTGSFPTNDIDLSDGENMQELKRTITEEFNSMRNRLDAIHQYNEIIIKQVEIKKDIEALQVKLAAYDNIIKIIVGTIITALITAILALVLK